METVKPSALDIIANEAMTGFPQGQRAQTIARNVLAALEAAGYVVLDECARCGEDPRAHWCADLEETFN